MTGVRKKIVLLVCAVLLAVYPALAQAMTVDFSRKGSMTVHLEAASQNISGAVFALYRVGDVDNTNGNVFYKTNTAYSGSGVTFDYKTSGEAQIAAAKLDTYIKAHNLPSQATQQTGTGGIAKFLSLDVGVYFLRVTGGGPAGLVVSPLIMPIPYFSIADDGTGSLDYNVTVVPKAEIVPTPTPTPSVTPTPTPTVTPTPTITTTRTSNPNLINLTLRKTWVDNNNSGNTRPTDGLTVYVYRKIASDADYTLLVTVVVPYRRADYWYLTIRGLERYDANGAEYEYFAREEVPAGYEVTYTNNGFTMVDTYPNPPTPTPTPIVTLTPTPYSATTRPPTNVRYIDGEWVYVDEYDVPLGVLPQTGDETSWLLMGLAILLPLLLGGCAVVVIYRRKRRESTR